MTFFLQLDVFSARESWKAVVLKFSYGQNTHLVKIENILAEEKNSIASLSVKCCS